MLINELILELIKIALIPISFLMMVLIANLK